MSEVTPSVQPVVITDIHMPFWSMVVFMLKWAIAAIPAFIILKILAFVAGAIGAGIVGLPGH
jgi:hypothetical protein